MEGYTTSDNFNDQTIARIFRATQLVLGHSDWLTRKQLLEGLAFARLPISYPQLYKDVELLQNCQIKGFNYFRRDKGFDRSSSKAIVIFRWMATRRSRGQAILHLPELMEIINNYDRFQRSNYPTVEVEHSTIN